MKNARCLLFVVASLILSACRTTTCPFPMEGKSGKAEQVQSSH